MIVDFDKTVEIRDWTTGNVVASGIEFPIGLSLMTNSSRFDRNHTTSSVRLLDDEDAHALELDAARPITFRIR